MNCFAKCVLLTLGVLSLGACIDVETRIELNEDLSGRFSVSYAVDTELWELGVFDKESSVRALPMSREDFERTVRRTEGVELVSYSRTQSSRSSGDEVTEIDAVLGFSDLEALNGVYAPDRSLISVSENGENEAVYTQELRPPHMQRITDQEFLESYFDGYTVSFEVETPAAAVSTNRGDLLERNRGAGVSLGLEELLGGEGDFAWEIRYEK